VQKAFESETSLVGCEFRFIPMRETLFVIKDGFHCLSPAFLKSVNTLLMRFQLNQVAGVGEPFLPLCESVRLGGHVRELARDIK